MSLGLIKIVNTWTNLKEWIYKEKLLLDNWSINDKISGNYILQFDRKHQLIYINEYNEDELSTMFNFPKHVDSVADTSLEKLMKHPSMFQSMRNMIEDMVENTVMDGTISKPHMNVKIDYDERNRMKGFTLIFRNSLLKTIKDKNFFNQFDYVISPLKSSSKNITFEAKELPDNAGEGSLYSVSRFSNGRSAFGKKHEIQKRSAVVEGSDLRKQAIKHHASQKKSVMFSVLPPDDNEFHEMEFGKKTLQRQDSSESRVDSLHPSIKRPLVVRRNIKTSTMKPQVSRGFGNPKDFELEQVDSEDEKLKMLDVDRSYAMEFIPVEEVRVTPASTRKRTQPGTGEGPCASSTPTLSRN